MANEEQVQQEEMAAEVTEQQAQDQAEEVVAEETEAVTDLPDAEKISADLDAALKEVDVLKDQLLRAQADVQNARRRAEQDVEKAHKFGLEKFANEMLPIIDNLERALESMGEDEALKATREGIEMTLNMFASGLAKFQVEVVNPVGETFDPALHQAMSMVPMPDTEPNSVVTVVQKGYTLHGRLIRPAMVMVAKG